ncbi:RNA methyltransferase [Chloroflexi bacterium TSY]|nr:RNA methyltransferase [Chloroflexi bacterium TSY]
MPILITSPQNPQIKDILKLTKRRRRDERKLTVVEGVREVSRALASGIHPVEAYICPELIVGNEAERTVEKLLAYSGHQLTLYEVSKTVFAKIAYRSDSGGLLLVIPYLTRSLHELSLAPTPFLAVLEGIEKPGNLGAILRTADAAGVTGVIVCTAPEQSGTDVHNPNAVRASLGTLFNVPTVEESTENTIFWLQQNEIQIVVAMPDSVNPGGTIPYTDVDMRQGVVVVLGSEAHGLSQSWQEAATHCVSIPMVGIADSLNLSTAAALLFYEVVRQRMAAKI